MWPHRTGQRTDESAARSIITVAIQLLLTLRRGHRLVERLHQPQLIVFDSSNDTLALQREQKVYNLVLRETLPHKRHANLIKIY